MTTSFIHGQYNGKKSAKISTTPARANCPCCSFCCYTTFGAKHILGYTDDLKRIVVHVVSCIELWWHSYACERLRHASLTEWKDLP